MNAKRQQSVANSRNFNSPFDNQLGQFGQFGQMGQMGQYPSDGQFSYQSRHDLHPVTRAVPSSCGMCGRNPFWDPNPACVNCSPNGFGKY